MPIWLRCRWTMTPRFIPLTKTFGCSQTFDGATHCEYDSLNAEASSRRQVVMQQIARDCGWMSTVDPA